MERRHRGVPALPAGDRETPVVTMLEGGTPLIEAARLSERVGASVWLKFEGLNPTCSFKDRGMTMAISKAVDGRRRRSSALRPVTPRPRRRPTPAGPG